MTKKIIPLVIIGILIIVGLWRAPIIGNEWSKQTIYVGFLDMWYGGSSDEKAHAMWIDDDSTEGVFLVKRISEATGIKPVFAVIADRMRQDVADSLAAWQRQGAGIVLHGFRHERWKDWEEGDIEKDISQSRIRLQELGFDTARILKMVIPPHGCNTKAIRKVIASQGCQMISGATLVNPDRHVFQLGRIGITPHTNMDKMRGLLQKAYQRKAFVIFGTHSSIPDAFSVEKTQEVLTMAKEIGFCFDYDE